MHILMIVMSGVFSDARVRREALALTAAGHAVTIIGDRPSEEPSDELPGISVRFARLRRGHAKGSSSSRPMPALLRWALLPTHRHIQIRSFQKGVEQAAVGIGSVDAVHAHDFSALPVAAQLSTSLDAALVYDSHELWAGRRLEGRPTPFRRMIDRAYERRLGYEAAIVITVSHGIAECLRGDYGWPDVRVVRNTFQAQPYVRPNGPVGVLYAGRIDGKRDLETFAQVCGAPESLPGTVIGPDDGTSLRLGSRVQVRRSIAADELDELYREHGLALIPLTAGSRNHELALPNKLFQAVRAGVPVIAADLPELRSIVTRYRLGTLYRPGSVESLRQALDQAVLEYDTYVHHVALARQELSWDRDAAVLLEAYDQLERSP